MNAIVRASERFRTTLFVTHHNKGFTCACRGKVLGTDPSRENAVKRSLVYMAEANVHVKHILVDYANGKREALDV